MNPRYHSTLALLISAILILTILVVTGPASATTRKVIIVPEETSSKVLIDGTITSGEYAGHFTDSDVTGIEVYIEHDNVTLSIGLVCPGTGWCSIGLGPRNTGMDSANILIGYVADGEMVISDDVGEGWKHVPDTDRGGSDDILTYAGSEVDGVTTLEFQVLLNSSDALDHHFDLKSINGAFLGFHEDADDHITQHSQHSRLLDIVIATKEVVRTSTIIENKANILEGQTIDIHAHVTDDTGGPVPNGVVIFNRLTTFGELEVARGITDANGTVSVNYTPFLATPTVNLRADYIGNSTPQPWGEYFFAIIKASQDSSTFDILSVGELTPPLTVASHARDPTNLVPYFLVVVIIVGSLWTAFAIAISQGLLIFLDARKERLQAAAETSLRVEDRQLPEESR